MFMRDSFCNSMFKCMRKWPVPDIMEQDRDGYCFFLLFCYIAALASKCFDCKAHEMHSAQSMMEACMQCAGVNQMGHTQLFYIAEPLEIGMLYKVEYQFGRNTDKSVNRVVYYFFLIQTKFFKLIV